MHKAIINQRRTTRPSDVLTKSQIEFMEAAYGIYVHSASMFFNSRTPDETRAGWLPIPQTWIEKARTVR